MSGSHTLSRPDPAPRAYPLRAGAALAVLGTIVVPSSDRGLRRAPVCAASVAALGLTLGREAQAVAPPAPCRHRGDPPHRPVGFLILRIRASALAALAVVGPVAAIARSTKRRIRGDMRIILRRLTEMVFTAATVVSLSGSVPVWGSPHVAAEPAVPVAARGLAVPPHPSALAAEFLREWPPGRP